MQPQPGAGAGQPFQPGTGQPFQPGVGQPFQPGVGQPFQGGFGGFPYVGQFGQVRVRYRLSLFHYRASIRETRIISTHSISPDMK